MYLGLTNRTTFDRPISPLKRVASLDTYDDYGCNREPAGHPTSHARTPGSIRNKPSHHVAGKQGSGEGGPAGVERGCMLRGHTRTTGPLLGSTFSIQVVIYIILSRLDHLLPRTPAPAPAPTPAPTPILHHR